MAPDAGFYFDDLDEDTPSIQDSRARAIRRRRNVFRSHPAPDEPMGRVPSAWCIGSGMQQLLAPELAPFASWLEFGEDNRDRFRWALRDSLDELLDVLAQDVGDACVEA